MSQLPTISIDSDGYFKLPDGLRWSDEPTGQQWLGNLQINDHGACWLTHDGQQIIVEPFDKPYVAQQVFIDQEIEILLPYGVRKAIATPSLCVDQWDRFHGLTTSGIPFVLTHKAQAELFNLADEFSDESITIAGQQLATPDYYQTDHQAVAESFWTGKYQASPTPPWDLGGPHPSFLSSIPQIKPINGRVGVLGCGYGHDAAYFAELGHKVAAYDLSPRAISAAQNRYVRPNLKFWCQDIFGLSSENHGCYDYLVEHTFYCAIPPAKRGDLVKLWWNLLAEGGHLLGIFFVNPKRHGPPYGSSEWELKSLLGPYFDFRYWTRLNNSPNGRNGIELLVYAQKRETRKR